tara:strand:+ start:2710 stop:3627 length:918 start_codon:yes stop_codon:yes gene_type:complete
MSIKNSEFLKFKDEFTLRTKNNLQMVFDNYSNNVPKLLKPMKYSSLSGSKYIRSLLIYATGSALNIPPKLLDQPSVAIELIHTYTLIHDDLPCMDDDDIRRGMPSCHVAFDESSAVLAGDALQSLAFEILSEKKYKEIYCETYLNWVKLLAKSIGVEGVAGGQYLDLSINSNIVEVDFLSDIYMLKTGKLITPCILLPYILYNQSSNNKTDEKFNELMKLGNLLGLSFQIKDDLLGYTSSSDILGKTKNKDELRNQPNFVNILGIDETLKILEKNKISINMILKNTGLKNTIFDNVTNYIFTREF